MSIQPAEGQAKVDLEVVVDVEAHPKDPRVLVEEEAGDDHQYTEPTFSRVR